MKFWRQYRFRSLDAPYLELLEIADAGRHVEARGMIISEAEEIAFGAIYHVRLRADWTFEGLNLRLLDGRSLKLRSDGRGRWTENQGTPRPDLEDCVDIDLSGSPFTNSLPINRARLGIGEVEQFDIAYVDMASLDVSPVEQEYERLADQRYRFASLTGDFTAELSVDADGIVVDYPGLFQRLET